MLWRRSYDTPPPPLPDDDEWSQAGDTRYAELPPEVLPRTECLKDVVVRMLPYWYDAIVPDLRAGAVVSCGRARQLACGPWSSTSTASPTRTSSGSTSRPGSRCSTGWTRRSGRYGGAGSTSTRRPRPPRSRRSRTKAAEPVRSPPPRSNGVIMHVARTRTGRSRHFAQRNVGTTRSLHGEPGVGRPLCRKKDPDGSHHCSVIMKCQSPGALPWPKVTRKSMITPVEREQVHDHQQDGCRQRGVGPSGFGDVLVGALAGDQVDDPAGDRHRVVGEPLVVPPDQGDVDGRLDAVRPRGSSSSVKSSRCSRSISSSSRSSSSAAATSLDAMTLPALATIRTATPAISTIVARRSAGTAESGYRSRATLATCRARSPMRSRSALIRRLVTMMRRSVATGCWRASRSKARCPGRAQRVDLVVGLDHALGEIRSASSSAVDARVIADPDKPGHLDQLVADRVELLVVGVAHAVPRGRVPSAAGAVGAAQRQASQLRRREPARIPQVNIRRRDRGRVRSRRPAGQSPGRLPSELVDVDATVRCRRRPASSAALAGCRDRAAFRVSEREQARDAAARQPAVPPGAADVLSVLRSSTVAARTAR